MFEPTPELANVATALGPATSVTPVGRPLAAVELKPLSTSAVVPSKTLSPLG